MKTKFIKSKKENKEYIYYRCTHKKPSYVCKQKAVEVKKLDEQIDSKLAKYEFDPDFKKLLFKILDEDRKENPDENILIAKNLQDKISKLEIEKSNLTKLSCRGLIDDSEFVKQKNNYEKEINILKQKLVGIKTKANNNDELIKKVKFAVQARENFNKGGLEVKKDILSGLGTNQELKDRKLHILAHKWMIPIEKDLKGLETKFATLELNKLPLTKAKSELLNSLRCELRGFGDGFRTVLANLCSFEYVCSN